MDMFCTSDMAMWLRGVDGKMIVCIDDGVLGVKPDLREWQVANPPFVSNGETP
jgi:hypothetical protein